jgi:hypothetical protein
MLLIESQARRASDVSPLTLVEWFEAGVLAGRAGWSVARSGGRSRIIEVYNHALALAIRFGLAGAVADEFEALAACQLPGGGWSNTTCEDTMSLRNTCLAAGNLCLAGAALDRPDLARIGRDAVALVIGRQDADGMWAGATRDAWDATAAALGLLSAAASQAEGAGAAAARALAALADAQRRDGYWPGPLAFDAQVGSAGRLLVEIARVEGYRSATAAAVSKRIIAAQDQNGSWGLGLIEQASAAIEGLLAYALAGGGAPGLETAIQRGIACLIGQANHDGRWPEFPGGPTAIVPTCGALACLAFEAEYRAVSYGC